MAKPTRGGNKTAQPKQAQPQEQPKEDPVLGPKGDPVEPDVAVGRVNRANYAKCEAGEPGYENYDINCQRCIWAYELLRRGYDVEALPNNDEFGYVWKYIDKVVKNKTYSDLVDMSVQPGQKDRITTVQQNIEKQMKEWGDGTRAFVRIDGHVFNVEQIDGKTVVFEAQTGNRGDLRRWLKFHNVARTRMMASIMRTDDVEFRDDLSNVVKRRGS